MGGVETLKLRHLLLAVAMVCTSAVGGMMLWLVLGGNLARSYELPVTFVEPEYKKEVIDPEYLACHEYSQKSGQIMYDRQYGHEDMSEMSFKFIRSDDPEGMSIVLKAFDTPKGVDDDMKNQSVIRFGMYQFADCMIGDVKK